MELEYFTQAIKTIYGDHVRSIVLYGSAVSGDHSKKYSDYNVLIILNCLNIDELKKISSVTNKWIKSGNPPPLMFTEDSIRASADVFPMEFLDIKESNLILHGDDIFKDLAIDSKNLRLECEHELRGKLIKLHESYITTEGKYQKVGELLARSLSTFQILFKSILRLMGVQAPAMKKEAMWMLVEKLNLDTAVFDEIVRLRENTRFAVSADVENLFSRYVTQLEKVITCVDQM